MLSKSHFYFLVSQLFVGMPLPRRRLFLSICYLLPCTHTVIVYLFFVVVYVLPHVCSTSPDSICLSFLSLLFSLYVYVFGWIFTFRITLAPCLRFTIWSNSRPFSLSLFLLVCVCVCKCAHMHVLSFISVSSLSEAIGLAVTSPVCSFALGPAAGVWVSLDRVHHIHTHMYFVHSASI